MKLVYQYLNVQLVLCLGRCPKLKFVCLAEQKSFGICVGITFKTSLKQLLSAALLKFLVQFEAFAGLAGQS